MMTILQCDKPGFQRSQHCNRAADDKRRPQHEVHPYGRREIYLNQSRECHDDQAQEKDDENGWAVPRVFRGEIKTADLAFAAHVQKAGKQFSLAAPWAPAAERGPHRGDCRKISHPATPAPPLPSPHQ